MLSKYINKLVKRENLTFDEAYEAMDYILSEDPNEAQIAAYLIALRMKGEEIDEVSGSASAMNKKAVHIKPNAKDYVDCVGTGGDGTNTFNISTTAAFVIAGAGAKTAKHGNRAVSSKCGSADVLEELGVNIMAPTDVVTRCTEEIGVGFMFARTMHPMMKVVSGVRSQLKTRTIFNILGPLSNPSNAKHQVIGVFDPNITNQIASAMMHLGVVSGMSVCGVDNNMDELSTLGKTKISEIKDNKVIDYYIEPNDYGIKKAKAEDLRGGDAKENAKITLSILNGEIGPRRDIVVLNAGAAIYTTGAAESIADGIKMAEKAIDDKMAIKKLNELIKMTNN